MPLLFSKKSTLTRFPTSVSSSPRTIVVPASLAAFRSPGLAGLQGGFVLTGFESSRNCWFQEKRRGSDVLTTVFASVGCTAQAECRPRCVGEVAGFQRIDVFQWLYGRTFLAMLPSQAVVRKPLRPAPLVQQAFMGRAGRGQTRAGVPSTRA